MDTSIKKFNYSYRFRLYPTAEQRTLLAKHFGASRYLYNHFLTKRKDTYMASKISLKALGRALTRRDSKESVMEELRDFILGRPV